MEDIKRLEDKIDRIGEKLFGYSNWNNIVNNEPIEYPEETNFSNESGSEG
jgi:hypothetical protein